MIFARRVKDKEPGGERRWVVGERKRKRGRGAKNEVKFIRVQTDVNLFKLRDFGSGRGGGGVGARGREGERAEGEDGAEGDGVYCGATGAALFALSLRGTIKGWAWSEKDSILREIKKSAGLSFRSRFSDRKREACGPVP